MSTRAPRCASVLAATAFLFACLVAGGGEMRCRDAVWDTQRYVECENGFAFIGKGSAFKGLDQNGNKVYRVSDLKDYREGNRNDALLNLVYNDRVRLPWACLRPWKTSSCVKATQHGTGSSKVSAGRYRIVGDESNDSNDSDACPAFVLSDFRLHDDEHVLVRTVSEKAFWGLLRKTPKTQFALARCEQTSSRP